MLSVNRAKVRVGDQWRFSNKTKFHIFLKSSLLNIIVVVLIVIAFHIEVFLWSIYPTLLMATIVVVNGVVIVILVFVVIVVVVAAVVVVFFIVVSFKFVWVGWLDGWCTGWGGVVFKVVFMSIPSAFEVDFGL